MVLATGPDGRKPGVPLSTHSPKRGSAQPLDGHVLPGRLLVPPRQALPPAQAPLCLAGHRRGHGRALEAVCLFSPDKTDKQRRFRNPPCSQPVERLLLSCREWSSPVWFGQSAIHCSSHLTPLAAGCLLTWGSHLSSCLCIQTRLHGIRLGTAAPA